MGMELKLVIKSPIPNNLHKVLISLYEYWLNEHDCTIRPNYGKTGISSMIYGISLGFINNGIASDYSLYNYST